MRKRKAKMRIRKMLPSERRQIERIMARRNRRMATNKLKTEDHVQEDHAPLDTMEAMELPEIISRPLAAVVLNKHPRTLQKWRKRHYGPTFDTEKDGYHRASVQEWLRKNG